MEEQAVTDQVLERLTLQQQEAGPDNHDTRLTLQRSAATTLSGVYSPFQEQQGSTHPNEAGGQQQIALAPQSRRTSASQVGVVQCRQSLQYCCRG